MFRFDTCHSLYCAFYAVIGRLLVLILSTVHCTPFTFAVSYFTVLHLFASVNDFVCHKLWTETVIEFSLKSFAAVLKGSHVKWYTDSQAAAKIVEVGSMKLDLHRIARSIFSICIQSSPLSSGSTRGYCSTCFTLYEVSVCRWYICCTLLAFGSLLAINYAQIW